MVDYNLALVRSLGIETLENKLTISWSTEDALHVEALLIHMGWKRGWPFVVLHPTSRWLFKTWHIEGYAQVCDYIASVHGMSVVVTGGPDAKERQLVQEVLEKCRSRPIDLSGILSLKQLAACIAKADLFIGVDSAPMHIAAAVGTPVIALFGPSGDHMWGPWGRGHTVIKKGWDCQPCGRDGCNGTKVSRCLETIPAEDVIRAVNEKLREKSILCEN
jgi:heptosyltransferase-3